MKWVNILRFNSKKDKWLAFIIWGVIIFPAFGLITSYISDDIGITPFIIILLLLIILDMFVLWSWYATYYVLEDDALMIKSGPIKKIIKYSSIQSLQKTSNPLSSPALSMQRIEIVYGTYKVTLVSPINRDQFIARLREMRPEIALKSEVGFLKDY